MVPRLRFGLVWDGPGGFAGGEDGDAEEGAAGGDEESFEVVAAEGAVGGFVAGDGNELKELAGG